MSPYISSRLRRASPIAIVALSVLAGCPAPCPDSGLVCTVAGTGEPGANENETRAEHSPLYGPMDVIA